MLSSYQPTQNRYPLPELTVLTLTKGPDSFTSFEHLFVGQLLEEFKRIKRSHQTKGE